MGDEMKGVLYNMPQGLVRLREKFLPALVAKLAFKLVAAVSAGIHGAEWFTSIGFSCKRPWSGTLLIKAI